MFKTLVNTIALSSLLTCSAMAVANQADYKLMVIEQAHSSNDVNSTYENAFNRCALSVKEKNFSEAESLCTEAISLLSTSKVPGYKRRINFVCIK